MPNFPVARFPELPTPGLLRLLLSIQHCLELHSCEKDAPKPPTDDGGSGEGRSWGGLEEREEEEEEEAREDREEAANAASSVLLFFPPRQKEAPLKRRARLFFPLLPYPSPLRQDRKEREREGKEERETEDEEERGGGGGRRRGRYENGRTDGGTGVGRVITESGRRRRVPPRGREPPSFHIVRPTDRVNPRCCCS